jgi:predicted outer membrane repeat protein
MLLSPIAVVRGAVIYVDDDAQGGDGSSWTAAFRYLQDALALADANDEIRVAQGTYVPDQNSVHPGGSGDRSATFRLINGVCIRGGYAGYGEPDPDARDVDAYESVLSGDLAGDDGRIGADENSYHVTTGTGTDANAVLDGFVITAGNANGPGQNDRGGGMYNYHGSPTVSNCTFRHNNAEERGGGMFNGGEEYDSCRDPRPGYLSSAAVVIGCTFSENSAGSGAGICNGCYSTVSVTDCVFSGNSAGRGAGMRSYGCTLTATNCTFIGNSAGEGGGVSDSRTINATYVNCLFSSNTADSSGGGMQNSYFCNSTLINCEFSGNSAEYYGGGMYNGSDCHPTIINCIFSGNSADSSGGAIHSYTNNPGYSPVTNCIFTGNTAGGVGGAIYGGHCASPAFTNCTFYRNSARWRGGAIANLMQSFSSLANCILWANDADEGPQISNIGAASLSIDYCDIQGGRVDIDGREFVDWGPGNIDAEPYFADASVASFHPKSRAGRWEANEGRWTTDEVTSPCIDAGDPNSDWTAELWPHGKRVNMGAFGGTNEASMSLSTMGNVADIDGSGRVDYADMELVTQIWLRREVLLSEDLNRDATVNFYDFAEFVEEWLWDGL